MYYLYFIIFIFILFSVLYYFYKDRYKKYQAIKKEKIILEAKEYFQEQKEYKENIFNLLVENKYTFDKYRNWFEFEIDGQRETIGIVSMVNFFGIDMYKKIAQEQNKRIKKEQAKKRKKISIVVNNFNPVKDIKNKKANLRIV